MVVLVFYLFYNPENLGCIGFHLKIQRIWIVLGRCLFYVSKRSIGGASLCWSVVLLECIWNRKWNPWKVLRWFGCWTKWRVERKECFFCSYRCFRESEKLRSEIRFCKWAKFFVHVRLLKTVINFSQTKFVAIILVLLIFFNAIFRLTDVLYDPFDFSSLKTG